MAGKSVLSLALVAALIAGVYAGSISVGDGAYTANWEIDGADLVVSITAQTLGCVGFGFSGNGTMTGTGANLFIGGANADGSTYGTDYYGVGNIDPVVDPQQDYNLVSATEDVSATSLSFRRPLISSDTANDLPVTNSEVYILWSWGETDDIAYHGLGSRGAVLLNPYNP